MLSVLEEKMGNFGIFKGRNSTHFSISEKLQIFFNTKLKKQKKKPLFPML
jgi:hypothetical protein